MAPPNQNPKMMSSRLMNMKFMQRSAAAEAQSPRTPAAAEPAAKKQRLSNGSFNSTPASTPHADTKLPSNAPTPEDQRREEAFAREAEARGDSKWYLSFKEPQSPAANSPLRIVSAGYGALDSSRTAGRSSSGDEGSSSPPHMSGRRSFGKFNKPVEKQQKNEDSSDSDGSSGSESEDEEDESDDPTGVNALIAEERRQAGDKARMDRKAKKKAEGEEAARMANERRKKEVNLNNVTSISGFGGGGTRKISGLENRTCHKCGEQGHMKYMCPQTKEWKKKRGLI